MQRFITVILFFILSLNSIGMGYTASSCCGDMHSQNNDEKTCAKTCCQKPKKESHQTAHHCCQNLSRQQQNFIVDKAKESNVQQKKAEKKAQQKNDFLAFLSYSTEEKDVQTQTEASVILHQPPKLFIQYCSYLI
ncbi:MAG: hypothetical protein E6Q95_02625 [Chitinophagaceae bacterium]|nr:MAG: hypothetical protein E6Q95_02625 [Chitinophagaceae bacterium]